MADNGCPDMNIALGQFFSGSGGIAHSWCTARATLLAGKQSKPGKRCYCYSDYMLPVLLNGLRTGWQADDLALPLLRLKAKDSRGLLEWFRNDIHVAPTANALYVHRNTLKYRMEQISEIIKLNLNNFDDQLFMYLSLQLEQDD